MSKKSYPLFEPLPYYMSAMGMQGARFIEGAQEPVATPVVEPVVTPEPKDEALGEGGVKALNAEREAAKTAKAELATAQAALKKFQDAEKTAEELAAEKLTNAEKAAANATRKAGQYEAAAAAGLPLSAASRISGSTPEEMAADALELKALLGDSKPGGKLPPPDPSQGQGGGKSAPTSLNDAIKGHYA